MMMMIMFVPVYIWRASHHIDSYKALPNTNVLLAELTESYYVFFSGTFHLCYKPYTLHMHMDQLWPAVKTFIFFLPPAGRSLLSDL